MIFRFPPSLLLLIDNKTATVPTIGDALASLDDVCNDLAEVLRQISDIGAELAHKDRLSLNDVQEVRISISFRCGITGAYTISAPQILRDYDSSILSELEVDQRRSLIFRELKKISKSLQAGAKVVLGTSVPLRRMSAAHQLYLRRLS